MLSEGDSFHLVCLCKTDLEHTVDTLGFMQLPGPKHDFFFHLQRLDHSDCFKAASLYLEERRENKIKRKMLPISK